MDSTRQKKRRSHKINTSKLISRTLFLIALLAATLCFGLLLGCSKEDSPVIEQMQVLPPTLSGISPESGPLNTVVTIFGTHFGTDVNAIQLFFNDTEAEVQMVNNTQIKTVVPFGATTGLIKLNVKGITIMGPGFTYVLSMQVSTLAGSAQGFADGMGVSAKFDNPIGVSRDSEGNFYVADSFNHSVRKITPNGVVSTLAGGIEGFADGAGTSAQFRFPYGTAVDAGSNVYVADTGNHKIRKITPNGMVSTLAGSTQGFADGLGSNAKFDGPFGITVDPEGRIYVADFQNHKIRKITSEGMVSTLAGSTQGFADGFGANAQFAAPSAIITDDDDGFLYVADAANHRIRKLTSSGLVSTLAGGIQGFEDGPGASAKFDLPAGLAVDTEGNVYVADGQNHKLRKISPNGEVSTLAGSTQGFNEGLAETAQFDFPSGVVLDENGIIYLVDSANHKIRSIKQE